MRGKPVKARPFYSLLSARYRFFKNANKTTITTIAINQTVCMWIVISCPVADVVMSISYFPIDTRPSHQGLLEQHTYRLRKLQSCYPSGLGLRVRD